MKPWTFPAWEEEAKTLKGFIEDKMTRGLRKITRIFEQGKKTGLDYHKVGLMHELLTDLETNLKWYQQHLKLVPKHVPLTIEEFIKFNDLRHHERIQDIGFTLEDIRKYKLNKENRTLKQNAYLILGCLKKIRNIVNDYDYDKE